MSDNIKTQSFSESIVDDSCSLNCREPGEVGSATINSCPSCKPNSTKQDVR